MAAGGGRVVEIVAHFQTECYLSGVAPYGDSLVLLAYRPPSATGGSEATAQRAGEGAEAADAADAAHAAEEGESGTGWPEIVLVSWANEEISTDVIDVLGYERYRANDYLLAFSHPSGALVGQDSPMKARQPGTPDLPPAPPTPRLFPCSRFRVERRAARTADSFPNRMRRFSLGIPP